MTKITHSEYIRHNNKSALVRRWIATILLKSDLETHLTFNQLDGIITSGFDVSSLPKKNWDNAKYVRAWLDTELARCGKVSFNESDVFAINTQRIGKSLGLNKAELAILRFACLINSYKPIEAASEVGMSAFTEADVCDLLTELLNVSFERIFAALSPSGLLRQSGLVQANCGWTGTHHLTQWLAIPDMLAREIFRGQEDENFLLNVFYTTAPKSTLTMQDFPQRMDRSLLRDYLQASIKEQAVGANALLWGPPGTGKTEMARHLAQSLRKKCIEINSVDADGRSLRAPERLDCYRFGQAILARGSKAIIVFDEVEEVLCDGSYSRFGFRGESKFTKGLLIKILETNATPSIWITNTVDGVDPAYLRRFDLVVHLDTPMRHIKKKIALRAFKDMPMQECMIERMVSHEDITPAHITKVTRICERIGVKSPEHAAVIARQVLNGDLKAMQARPLDKKTKTKTKKNHIELPYRPGLINCNMDIERISMKLNADSSIRICAFGPPGTGKTAWARHLAKSVERPLLIKQAADIMDKYLGETEKNIRIAFDEASATNSVLLLDEADGFLPDRTTANRHWEITQANEFLTAMEQYDGILICATNLMGMLDPATMRRFDFKINFDYLKPEYACQVAIDVLALLDVKLLPTARSQLQQKLARLRLSHGDFAALLRRYSVLGTKPQWHELVADLKTEAGYRNDDQPAAIGFLANV